MAPASPARGWGWGELTGAAPLTILQPMNDVAPELARLSPQQRLDLIERLWDSLKDEDIPLTGAQRAELDRRIEGGQDRDQHTPWDQLKAELQQRR
jgi:putative addiction module component (TIGR02574 family)